MLTSLVQQWNEDGETPLVTVMKSSHFDLIDELVGFLRECDRESDMFLLAIHQVFQPEISIVDLIDHLTKELNFGCRTWLNVIARIVFESATIPRDIMIIALELIGASLYEYDQDGKYKSLPIQC